MASITYRVNKKNGRKYAYQSESFRDPITKKVKTKQKYLGVVDPETGQIVASLKNKTDNNMIIKVASESLPAISYQNKVYTTKVVGPYSILDAISENLGIIPALQFSFPKIYTDILSLVYYIVQTGAPLSNCSMWSRLFDHPSKKFYDSQNITDLLDNIMTEQIDLLMNIWFKKYINTEYLYYDIISTSSRNQNIPFIKKEHNRDYENLYHINLAMLFGQQTKLPAFYHRITGNIVDTQTLDSTIEQLDALGFQNVRFILDRSFYTFDNVDILLSKKSLHFTLAVPVMDKWVENILDLYSDSMCIPTNHHYFDDNEYIYCKSLLYKWKESTRRLYLHIYYNDYRAIEDYCLFIKGLKEYKELLESKKQLPELDNFFSQYLIIKEMPIRGCKIIFNDDKILEYKNKYAGYFCILSTFIKDPIAALHLYKHRDIVEKCFNDLKNETDMKEIGCCATNRMDSKIFLHFLASIYISQIRKITSQDEVLSKLSHKNILNDVSALQKGCLKGNYNEFYTEIDKHQRHILEVFGLSWPV
jgi:hypothetical protein